MAFSFLPPRLPYFFVKKSKPTSNEETRELTGDKTLEALNTSPPKVLPEMETPSSIRGNLEGDETTGNVPSTPMGIIVGGPVDPSTASPEQNPLGGKVKDSMDKGVPSKNPNKKKDYGFAHWHTSAPTH